MAFLLDDILLAPCKLVVAIGKSLSAHARDRLTDDTDIRRQLLALQEQYELGHIGPDEFCDQEDELMRQLQAVHKRRESL